MIKKIIAIILSLVMISVILCSCAKSVQSSTKNSTNDFRSSVWGFTKEQVKKTESSTPTLNTNNNLLYDNQSLLDLDCCIIYYFDNNKLYQGVYSFTNEHSNDTDYITDYNNIKAALIKKYGNPKEDNQVWKDNTYKDRPSDWGMAVITGNLLYGSVWYNGNTKIGWYNGCNNFRWDDTNAADKKANAQARYHSVH
jgi:hypothetical protein